jgi:hypothetical protein
LVVPRVGVRRLLPSCRVLVVGGAQRGQGLGEAFQQRLELGQAAAVGVVECRSQPMGY